MFLRFDFAKSSDDVKKWDGKVNTNPINDAANNNAVSVGQEK